MIHDVDDVAFADDALVGVDAITALLGPAYSRRSTNHMLVTGPIPGFKRNGKWESTKSAIRADRARWLAASATATA